MERAATVVDFTGTKLIGALVTFERGIPSEKLLAKLEGRPKHELRGKVTIPAGHQAVLLLMAPDDGPPGSAPDLSVLDQLQPDDLAVLVIQASRITGKEMERLARHKALRILTVGPLHEVSEKDLAPLRKLTWLDELSITGPALTNQELPILKDLPGAKGALKSLDLSRSAIDDEGLGRLQKHTTLRELDLSYTKVTDAGLVHLGGLTGLHKLSLADTQVSGSGLRHLSKQKKTNPYLADQSSDYR